MVPPALSPLITLSRQAPTIAAYDDALWRFLRRRPDLVAAILDRSGRVLQTRRYGQPARFDICGFNLHHFLSQENRALCCGMIRAALDFRQSPGLVCNLHLGSKAVNQRLRFWPYADGLAVLIANRIF